MPSTSSSSSSARSSITKEQPAYNMERLLASSIRDSPYVAGFGTRQRSKDLYRELDVILSGLEVADRARGGQ